MQTALRPDTVPATHGSRTMTVTATSSTTRSADALEQSGDDDDRRDDSSTLHDGHALQGGDGDESVAVLRLRGRAMPDQRVRWQQDVVDNEGLGRKKSKICCIYHKPKEFDESSDESCSDGDSDASSAGSADSREGARNPRNNSIAKKRKQHKHRHEHAHGPDCTAAHAGGSNSGQLRQNGPGSTMLERPSSPQPQPNAYERNPAPGGGKGKGRAS
ncbi:hypothetical protein ACM66B_003362 [Microbotryomycetes sp. NB124-2]